MYNSLPSGVKMESGYTLGQYVLVEKLGDGGMGEVWKGQHSHLDYEVAIKFLKPQFAHDADLQERFLNEGKRQAKLDHPNIVRAIDFISEPGRHYLVMKFIEGIGLDRRIEDSRGPLPLDETLEISYQVLSALGYAHSHGVIHRDVKPSNILIDRNRTCYLTDFGIALAVGQQRVTRTGTVIGTAYYMSPEQIRRPHTVDQRSDVYAFGVVLFEMLTGVPPFDAEDGNEFLVKQAHVEQQPPKPSNLNPAVTKQIEAVVLCALAKNPDERWSTCEEMIEALELAGSGKLPLVRRTRPQGMPTPAPVIATPPTRSGALRRASPPATVQTERLNRNRLRMQVLGVGAMLALIIAVGAKTYFGRPPHRDVPVPISSTIAPARPPEHAPGSVSGSGPRAGDVAGPRSPNDGGATPPSGKLPTAPAQKAGVPSPVTPSPGAQGAAPTQKELVHVDESRVDPQVPILPPGQKKLDDVSGSKVDREQPSVPLLRVPPPVERVIDDPGTTALRQTERVDISRPDDAPRPTVGPPPGTTIPQQAAPASGTLNWSVQLRKNIVESLTASQASSGQISGDPLPGVPVAVSISPANAVGVVEAPSPTNGWKTLKLRSLVNANIVISIQWRRL